MAPKTGPLTADIEYEATLQLMVLSPAYLRLMEEKLEQAVAERDEAQRKRLGGLLREDELAEMRKLDDKVFFGKFWQTHRYGYVSHIVSTLENTFRNIWKEWSEEDTFDTPSLGHDLTEKLNYCYQQASLNRGVKIPAALMQPIQDLLKVRNCIVHHSGHVTRSKYKKHLKKLTRPGYQVQDDYIWLGREFCEWALRAVQDFYTQVGVVFKAPAVQHPSRPTLIARLLRLISKVRQSFS